MMKRVIITFVTAVIFLSCTAALSGEVVLMEDFNTNLDAWTVLNGSGGATTSSVSGGQLHITQTNSPTWEYAGVESKVAYVMPTGGQLIVDFYGTNIIDLPNALNTHSAPGYLLSQYQSTGSTFQGWKNFISIKRKDTNWGNWVQWQGVSSSGYTDIGNIGDGTYGTTPKHMIFVIDAANINIYIADDYYENLVNPVAIHTAATSSIFDAEWKGAVYINMMSEKTSAWYTGTTVEDFDGVKVTLRAHIPADCNEAIIMGYGIAGDINRDCSVDMSDLKEVVQSWLNDMSL